MDLYNGTIQDDFLKADIEFNVDLPEYCENQEFELWENVNDDQVQILAFSLIFNLNRMIDSDEEGLAIYTGEIITNEVETIVISQVSIEKDDVEDFKTRKFKLKVL